jgi:hypothetical protein
MKLGSARANAWAAWRLIDIDVDPQIDYVHLRHQLQEAAHLTRARGRYLLRSNLHGRDPGEPSQFYIRLTEVEAAFKNLKDDLQLHLNSWALPTPLTPARRKFGLAEHHCVRNVSR